MDRSEEFRDTSAKIRKVVEEDKIFEDEILLYIKQHRAKRLELLALSKNLKIMFDHWNEVEGHEASLDEARSCLGQCIDDNSYEELLEGGLQELNMIVSQFEQNCAKTRSHITIAEREKILDQKTLEIDQREKALREKEHQLSIREAEMQHERRSLLERYEAVRISVANVQTSRNLLTARRVMLDENETFIEEEEMKRKALDDQLANCKVEVQVSKKSYNRLLSFLFGSSIASQERVRERHKSASRSIMEMLLWRNRSAAELDALNRSLKKVWEESKASRMRPRRSRQEIRAYWSGMH